MGITSFIDSLRGKEHRMGDTPNDMQRPALSDLVKAAEPSRSQKFWNFIGLGYGGNTAVSIVSVKLARKFFPGFVEKWEDKHARKYIARKTEELVTPVADKLDAASKAVLEEKIAKDAKIYGEKTVNSRLLSTGGFAMLPFQSEKQIRDYNKNVKPHISDFREKSAAAGFTPEQTEQALREEIQKQRSTVRDGDKKSAKILDGALKEPKKSLLGPDARDDLPKWIIGRVIALGAAFTTQSIVDDRFAKPKDALDNTIAKIVTKVMNPGKSGKEADLNGTVFEGLEAPSTTPEGVDPKVLDIVRMITTDAYMTTVAIGAHMASMNYWDKKAPDMVDKFKALQSRLSGSTERTGGPPA